MKTKEIKIKQDGRETERFVDLARKLVAAPKKEIDQRIEEERQIKEQANAAKSEAKKQRA